MKHLIVWSGGYDSTAIVRSYLEKNIEFDTVYITLQNNADKSKMEKKRRKSLKNLFYRKYDKKFHDTVIEIPIIDIVPSSVATYHQPHLWILGLLHSLRYDTEYETAAFGYLRHADFWHIKQDISDYYEAAKKCISPTKQYDLTPLTTKYHFPKLYYPLEWYTKKQVIDGFYSDEFGRQLFNIAWTCERPLLRKRVVTPCNICNTCIYLEKQIKEIDEEKEAEKNHKPITKTLKKN